MVSTRLVVGIALAGVAAAAIGTYSYNRVQQQRSLQQGIAQTQQALAKVDDLIADNQVKPRRLMDRRPSLPTDIDRRSLESLQPK